MLINYGSFMYFAYIFAAIGVCLILYLFTRNCPRGVQKAVVLILALLNVIQHIFKREIYPQYDSNSPVHIITAYNICAFLILISPLIILFGNNLLKNFITYVGSFAGMVAMVVPYWFIGQSAFTWEAYRFYICHGLLFISSMLPGLLGLHKLNLRHCWKIGFLFFGALLLILLNNAILIKTGNYPGTDPNDLFGALSVINPGWSMRPSASMAWVEEIVALFTPAFFLGDNPWGVYVPILWYAIPLYLGITFLTHLIFAVSRIFVKRKAR